MARPKGRTGQPTNLYLPEATKAAASRMASARNMSLSQLIAELVETRIKRSAAATKGATK